MKMKLMFLAAVMFGCASFAQPVHIIQGLAPLLDNQHVANIPALLPQPNQQAANVPVLLAQPQINQPNMVKKCLSFFKKDVHCYFSLTSVGTAAVFLYFTKDINIAPFDRVTGSLAAYMVPQLTAGAIALVWGKEVFLD